MSDTVIRVEDLSKRYFITHQTRNRRAQGGQLTEKIQQWVSHPVRRILGRKSDALDGGKSEREEFWALKDVSFEVKRGDVLGIIGRNGAGKSTLLKILSRITEPTRGEIKVKGRIASLLEVGTGFHPELTGRENIFLNGSILGMSRAEIQSKFDEIIAFAEIEKFLDTQVKHYSSGMYVRLAFAVAAHLEPEILIIDEVLAVGDAAFQQKCFKKVSQFTQGNSRTVILVSHQLHTVRQLCNTAVLLKSGGCQSSGETDSVLQQYLLTTSSVDNPDTFHHAEKQLRISDLHVSGGYGSGQLQPDNCPIEFSFKLTNQGPPKTLYFSIHLFDYFGNRILASANFRSACSNPEAWVDTLTPIGPSTVSVSLPAHFLNCASYYADLFVTADVNGREIYFHIEKAFSISVDDSGTMRQEYHGPWPGLIRPKLEWRQKSLKHDLSPAPTPLN